MGQHMRPFVETWGPAQGLSIDPNDMVELLICLGGTTDAEMDTSDDRVVVFARGAETLDKWAVMNPSTYARTLLNGWGPVGVNEAAIRIGHLSHHDVVAALGDLQAMTGVWRNFLDDGMLKLRVGN